MSVIVTSSKINTTLDKHYNMNDTIDHTKYSTQPCFDSQQIPSSKLSSQPYQLNNKFASLYQLVDQIGSGGYGFVMSAVHRVTKQEVAVKFIYKSKLPLDSRKGLPLEISILKKIQHPTVINYIDHFEDDIYHYLVMELYGCEWIPSSHELSSSSSLSSPVTPKSDENDHFSASLTLSDKQQKVRRSSCDLFECIERHTKLSEAQTHKIFKQIVQCVYDLSNIGVYHRDIKDENIVIDSDFKVKLVDFGSAITVPLSQEARDQYTITKFHGTVSFASPEILLGLPYRPEPAEVWSLGVLLFTLLYGQLPFSESNQVITATWNRSIQPKSSDCMDLLCDLLKSNPKKRLTIKEILQHPWMNTVFG